MKKKIVSVLFITSFVLSGCGIESLFTGHAVLWFISFVTACACAIILGG